MHYRRLVLLIVLTLVLFILCGMAAVGDENLFYNLTYFEDTTGGIDAWGLSEGAIFSTYEHDEYGTVARIDCGDLGNVIFDQDVVLQGENNYGIRFRARILEGNGSIMTRIEDHPSAQSDSIIQSEWTVVELYGRTSPEQQSLPVAFVIDSTGVQNCVVEITQMEFFRADQIPEGAKFVWFYDRTAWEAANETASQEEKGITGFSYLLILTLVYAGVAYAVSRMKKKKALRIKHPVRWLLGGCFVLSCILAVCYRGHPTDINNFSAWAQQLANVGIPDFYTSGIWADYPPGYMYVLYVCGMLGKLFGVVAGHPLFTLFVKLPAMLADLGCAYLIYRFAKNRFSERASLFLCALMALNPMVLLDSAIWGQMDSILTLILALALWFYLRGNKPVCAALFVLGVLVKPQMLAFGPLLFVVFAVDIVKDPKQGFKSLGLSILAGVGTLLLVALPFSKGQGTLWLWDLYTNAANLYRYASVNAFNFYALLGMNWAQDSTVVLFGLRAAQIGMGSIVIMCATVGILYVRDGEKHALIPLCAILMWGIFAFSQNMHERYLFPSIFLFLWAYVDTQDRRFLSCSVWTTAVTFLNSGIVLFNSSGLLMGFSFEVIFISALNIVGLGYAFYAWTRRKMPDVAPTQMAIAEPNGTGDDAPKKAFVLRIADRTGEKMCRFDYILVCAITVVYAFVALINLGSTKVPQNYWRPMESEESILVDFGKPVDIANCYYYPGVGLGRVELTPSVDGTSFAHATRLTIGGFDMYSWQTAMFSCDVRYVRIKTLDAKVLINEMAFLDVDGNVIPVESVAAMQAKTTSDPMALFDEQQYVDLSPDYMTEMYFDEVYHARTAFEHIKGFAPYENTHPPLGKMFIMFGIWLFGMNPFGWRIVGTLFGIFMLPLLYVFAKRLLRDTRCAAFATFLFAADGMHFAQTRIATIDVYGVFFIIAMCYFMFRYWQMNFYVDGLKKTLIPLGLSGVLFGLGTASKWIGLYAGLGLAVTFFLSLGMRYMEYRRAKLFLANAQEEENALCERVVRTFWRNAVLTCLFCLVFFVVIPVGIYILSYLPYLLCAEKSYALKDVWGIQTYMFNYHNNLTATHPFQSAWYTWPLIIKPIYYFSGTGLAEGTMQAIASFGNPAVWWSGLAAVFYTCYLLIKKRVNGQMRSNYVFILICLGAAYLPWTLITRATFIYHYFASVPFIILLTASLIRLHKKRGMPAWAWIIGIASVLLFVLFYPVWSGMPINRDFAQTFMQWMPSWWFFS